MKEKNYLLVSLNDSRAKKIAQVIGNESCEKILNYLAINSNSSEKDISDALKIPLNTVEYNIKKLIDAELIEKSKKFFWSLKGRKINLYKVSNKSIIISPRKENNFSKLKLIIPLSLVSGFISLWIRLIHPTINVSNELGRKINDEIVYSLEKTIISNADLVQEANISHIYLGSPIWWFFGGIVLTFLIFILVENLIKLKGGYIHESR
jgi:DNA-binding transcriptional ArsR family regulator